MPRIVKRKVTETAGGCTKRSKNAKPVQEAEEKAAEAKREAEEKAAAEAEAEAKRDSEEMILPRGLAQHPPVTY